MNRTVASAMYTDRHCIKMKFLWLIRKDFLIIIQHPLSHKYILYLFTTAKITSFLNKLAVCRFHPGTPDTPFSYQHYCMPQHICTNIFSDLIFPSQEWFWNSSLTLFEFQKLFYKCLNWTSATNISPHYNDLQIHGVYPTSSNLPTAASVCDNQFEIDLYHIIFNNNIETTDSQIYRALFTMLISSFFHSVLWPI